LTREYFQPPFHPAENISIVVMERLIRLTSAQWGRIEALLPSVSAAPLVELLASHRCTVGSPAKADRAGPTLDRHLAFLHLASMLVWLQ